MFTIKNDLLALSAVNGIRLCVLQLGRLDLLVLEEALESTGRQDHLDLPDPLDSASRGRLASQDHLVLLDHLFQARVSFCWFWMQIIDSCTTTINHSSEMLVFCF